MVIVVVLWCFVGWDELFFLFFYLDSIVGYCGGVGVYWIIGGGVVFFLLFGRFCLGCVGGFWFVVFVIVGVRCFLCWFNWLCVGIGGWGLLGYLYFKWVMCRSGIWFCDGGNWFVDCSVNFCVNWSALGWWSILVLVGYFIGFGCCYFFDCFVLFVGNDCFYLFVNMDIWYVDEYGIGVGCCFWDDFFWRNIDIYIVIGVWCYYCCFNGVYVDSM